MRTNKVLIYNVDKYVRRRNSKNWMWVDDLTEVFLVLPNSGSYTQRFINNGHFNSKQLNHLNLVSKYRG